MNPIVATGIVSAGKNLIENLVSPSSKTTPPPAGKFDTELRKAEFSQEIPETVLRKDFLKSDEVKSFLEANSGSEIHLEARADGSIQLVASSGSRLVLDKGTQACAIGQKLIQTCLINESNISTTRPNAIILRN